MKIIIFDFEVFMYDVLFGALIVGKEQDTIIQTWDIDEIKNFYKEHEKDLWIGQNILHYDLCIMETILKNKNAYEVSQDIISRGIKHYNHLPVPCFDLMFGVTFYSLKTTECAEGKNICESSVSFDLDRPLTEEEKKDVKKYNLEDLKQEKHNFYNKNIQGYFQARLELCKMFKLPAYYLSCTEAQAAERILDCHKIRGIEFQTIKPPVYNNLQLDNEDLKEYYFSEGFRSYHKKKIMVNGLEHTIGSGGLHSAIKKYHCKKAIYCDVSGYYNLVMMNYDLLPRSMSPEAKKVYAQLYEQKQEYKKTAPLRASAVKVVTLCVFGAELNEHSAFYDPAKGLLVTITGQLFIVDLLEKMEGIAKIVQCNTDGIVVEPYNWKDKDKVNEIIDEWCYRTGFKVKREEIYDIYQRDVNCYIYRHKDGSLTFKGEAVKDYNSWEDIFDTRCFQSKEPPIIAQCIVDYLMYNIDPKETVNKYKDKLRMFQYIAKKLSFDYLELEEHQPEGEVKITRLQHINRAFASNSKTIGMIYKKRKEGKVKKTKVANLPDNVFVYNNEILSNEVIKKLQMKIDYNYYIDRAWERIGEFFEIKE